jgi:hypothetical protein
MFLEVREEHLSLKEALPLFFQQAEVGEALQATKTTMSLPVRVAQEEQLLEL